MIFYNNHFDFLPYLLHLCALSFETAVMIILYHFFLNNNRQCSDYALHLFAVRMKIDMVTEIVKCCKNIWTPNGSQNNSKTSQACLIKLVLRTVGNVLIMHFIFSPSRENFS